jgi:hypothetical protein
VLIPRRGAAFSTRPRDGENRTKTGRKSRRVRFIKFCGAVLSGYASLPARRCAIMLALQAKQITDAVARHHRGRIEREQ